MDITQAFIKFRDDIKELIANNLNAIGKPSVAYNEETDNIDFYTENGVRSIATGLNEPVGLVPVLSADDGKVIYSGQDASYPAYNLFNDDDTVWAIFSDSTNLVNSYVGYNFNKLTTITKFAITNEIGADRHIASFKLQGLTETGAWVDIESYTNPSGQGVVNEFTIGTPKGYHGYRIHVVSTVNSSALVVKRLQFYGYNELGIALPEATKNVTIGEDDKYDSTKTYAVGDYCIENDILYKCTTAVETAEEFDSGKWEATTVVTELGCLGNAEPETFMRVVSAEPTVPGYIGGGDGEIVAQTSDNEVASEEYYQVKPGQTVTISAITSSTAKSWAVIGVYDETKAYIVRHGGEGSANCTNVRATIPENGRYVRVSWRDRGASIAILTIH